MAANSSIVLSQLDFDSYKGSLQQFLKSQDEFKDYNFDSSNMNVLLDVLSYNTYLQTFYLNMVGNEMFLDSAKLRDSVISHSKELNYLPRSFRSAVAKINVVINATDPTKKSIVMPKGTSFISRVGDDSFSFSTDNNIVSTSSNSTFVIEDVEIYEGSFLNETYIVDYVDPIKYKINNKKVDISSVEVLVIEDNGSNQIEYRRTTSLFDLDETSMIFFIQPTSGETYEIVFGDGVIGRRPKNNSIIIIEYRICNGELPNGAQKFISSGRIDGEANITVSTVQNASSGAVAESLESIKYNAPRAFTTQERAVTAEDYENLLKTNFPEVNAVVAYGGEDANPPQYGKVFVSVDLKDIDGLPIIKREEYTKFLRSRSTVAMESIFISPEYTYLDVRTNVKYNINKTGFNPDDIRTIVTSSMLNFASINLNNFSKTLRYSRFINDIDDSDSSILSNETEISLIKYVFPKLNVAQNISIDFKIPLLSNMSKTSDEHLATDNHGVYTSSFTYEGQAGCIIEDDGDGTLNISVPVGASHRKLKSVGIVDYDRGQLNIDTLNISNLSGSVLKVYVVPRNKDISSNQNTILNILEPDISITVEQIRE